MKYRSSILLKASIIHLLAMAAFADPAITSVTAQQRYPWNGKVDITYTVSDIAAAAKEQGLITSLKVTATDQETGMSYTATSLSGDTGLSDGTHSLVWDMDAQGLSLKSTNVVFSVSCETTPATYCVIDLSAGSSASSYPVTYLAAPPSGGFNVDAYKTTKLVLKRIEAGNFKMQNSSNVTLTKPFFLGLFEMTQKQYSLVTGSNPSNFSGDKKPVETISYEAIRGSSNGAQWPSSNAVDSTSFLGKLRARTGLDFDLPTEAQWEYACRAGTTTTYSYGNSANGNYMWYMNNSSWQTHEVGTKQPNPWGLYDMHGNVWERCLDWYGTLSYGTDPKGSSSGSDRVFRGGGWPRSDSYCTSSYRYYYGPSYENNSSSIGFRLARVLTTNAQAATLCSGVSSPTIIDLSTGTRTAALAETIRYSTAWETSAAGATAEVAVNGETLSSVAGSGEIVWKPTRNGTYTLTHTVMNGGTQVGATLTATFEVCHFPAAPVIFPTSGVVVGWPQNITISCATAGAALYYTTDGTEPTAASTQYRRFRISGKTTVKAIAIKDGLMSEVAVAEYASGLCSNPVVTAASSFTGSKTSVALSCPMDGATIRYTLDGSTPDAESPVYSEPFDVTNSCTVKAYATYPDYFDSEVVSFAIEKVWGIGDTMGVPDQVFSTGGDAPFFRVTDTTAPLGEAMQSGAITHSQSSTMTTTVTGPGTVFFQWKTSCEDSDGVYDWDHAEFEVDGDVVEYLDGETAWQTISHDIAGDGSHTLVWRYVKDDMSSEGDDCCWVADFRWTPATAPTYTETQTTPEPVPYIWLRGYYPEIADEYEAYETAAKATAANGVNKVWECYVAGIDPTDATAKFVAAIEMDADGSPRISWDPDLNENGTKTERVYTVEGKADLADPWGPTNNLSRFFRVKAGMPE